MQSDRDFNKITQEKGLDGLMSFFSEDSVVPAHPPLAGKPAIAEHWRKILTAPGLTLSWEPLKGELFPSGVMGYTTGKYVVRFSDANGKKMEQTGRYITVWKKQDDGTWKVIADTGSEDGPPHPVQ